MKEILFPLLQDIEKKLLGNLSDEILRNLNDRLSYLRNLEKRKEEVIKSIEEQGKLTDEISKKVETAITLAEVEDIYRPYKQKKKTRATIAKSKGLEPLSIIIYLQNETMDIEKISLEYVNPEKEVHSVEEAISGALDIIAENISDNADYRKHIKKLYYREGFIVSKASNEDEKTNYEMYYDYREKISQIPSHRILAINRGEKEEALKVKLEKPEDKIIEYMENDIIKGKNQFEEMLKETILDSFKRLIEPSVEREIRSDLTEKAETQAIKVFGKNAKQLLLGAPIKRQNCYGL